MVPGAKSRDVSQASVAISSDYRKILYELQLHVIHTPNCSHELGEMSGFRSKRLDVGCFINAKVIRDHTKR